MNRGGSHGRGQSSLGYLFGSEEKPTAPPATQTVSLPPYGVDTITENPHDQDNNQSPNKQNASNNYPRAQGMNIGNFITDRPSTKVKSAPGGDSTLGYLFGDK